MDHCGGRRPGEGLLQQRVRRRPRSFRWPDHVDVPVPSRPPALAQRKPLPATALPPSSSHLPGAALPSTVAASALPLHQVEEPVVFARCRAVAPLASRCTTEAGRPRRRASPLAVHEQQIGAPLRSGPCTSRRRCARMAPELDRRPPPKQPQRAQRHGHQSARSTSPRSESTPASASPASSTIEQAPDGGRNGAADPSLLAAARTRPSASPSPERHSSWHAPGRPRRRAGPSRSALPA